MDFLDIQFASVNRAKYAGFLGIDFNAINPFKKPVSAYGSYLKDLSARYPFTDFCDTQSEVVAALRVEADGLWQRYSNEVNPDAKRILYEKSAALDAYIKLAVDYMNTVSCPKYAGGDNTGVAGGQGTLTDTVLNSSSVKERVIPVIIPVVDVSRPSPQLIKGVDNNILKYAACGIILLAVVKMIR